MTLEAVVDAPDVGFDVVDVLSGLARLVRRSPTLDGSVPLRVAQGCAPLLEGNAWGHAIALSRRIVLKKKLGGWTVASFDDGDELARMTRASVPLLLGDHTLTPGTWVKRLERGVVDAGRTISLFTGLFVRPRPGVRLRQSTLANRRSVLYTIDEAILDDGSALTPLVLDIVPAPGVDAITLEGELASLAALPAKVTFSRCTLADAADIARAHVGFYNADYFATKKRGHVARTYRDDVVRRSRANDRAADSTGHDPSGEVHVRVVDGGPSVVEPAAPVRFHRPGGPITAPAGTAPERLVVRNAVPFTATYDGYTVTIDHDRAALDRYAADVRNTWTRWLDASGTPSHDGALLYLTKYFTPHPPGEPHFFVKPCALIASSAGSSTVIDGRPGAGYDVMRGVVRTDSFHAAPAVFQLWRPGETMTVPRGTVLAELFAFPRALDDTSYDAATAGAGGTWS